MFGRLRQANIELVVWLVLAGAFFGITFTFDQSTGTFAWGAAFWPRVVLAIMASAAVLNYASKVTDPNKDGGGSTSDRTAARLSWRGAASVLGMIGIPVVFAWLIPRTGFYFASLAFIPTYMIFLGERRASTILSVTLGLFVVINLVFTRIFYVALPTGQWSGFYDVSSWFVTMVRA